MGPIPVGALLFGVCVLLAVAPIRRPPTMAAMSWLASAAPNELPFVFGLVVIAANAPSLVDGEVGWPRDWISLIVGLATLAGLAVVARRGFEARAVLDRAFRDQLGPEWRDQIEATLARPRRRRVRWMRILAVPWPFRPSSIERIASVSYGERGSEQTLDVFRHRTRPLTAPTLIHFHGGRFRTGRKNFEARPLIHRLASQGWTCISANYHLSATPGQGFPTHLVDAKRVIVWARTVGLEYGIDPEMIFVAGSSAGAHIAAMAAVTPNQHEFQPGFEMADTTIVAGIGLYGYYGLLDDDLPSSDPLSHAGPTMAPLLVVHGGNDTYTPAGQARRFIAALRNTSARPIIYAELPGAQHSFDLFHSVRFEAVVDSIEEFTSWMRSTRMR